MASSYRSFQLGFCSAWPVAVAALIHTPPLTAQDPPDPERAALRAEALSVADSVDAKVQPGNFLNALNPSLTVFADLLYQGVHGKLTALDDAGNPVEVGDRFALREVEVDLRADIDQHAKGVFILALEEELPEEYAVTIEEGYATFETLPFNLHAKAGRFRTAFGATNRLHTHDLPTFDRPLAVQRFLGEEGDVENGLQVSWLAPGERWSGHLTYELLNGENDAVLAGPEANRPAHLARASLFRDIGARSWFEVGCSALFGEAVSRAMGGGDALLIGGDATFRWQPKDRTNRSVSVQAEVFALERDLPGDRIHSLGAYGMVQVQPTRNLYVGGRYDWTELADADRGEDTAVSAWLSWYSSEFLRVRVGYQHLDAVGVDADHIVFAQLTTVFGSHPAHPYWVSK